MSESFAQSNPPGTKVGPDGTIYVMVDVSQSEYDDINKALGGAADDGSISTDDICDALMKELPGGFLRTLADIGSFFGACPSTSDVIDGALKDNVFPELKRRCEELSGLYPATLAANGCEIPSLMILECAYTDPDIPRSCDGLRELCESSKAGAGISPPDKLGPGQLIGSFKIPGCHCDARYIMLGEPVLCGVPGPITHGWLQ